MCRECCESKNVERAWKRLSFNDMVNQLRNDWRSASSCSAPRRRQPRRVGRYSARTSLLLLHDQNSLAPNARMDSSGVQPYSNLLASQEVDTTAPIPLESLKGRTVVITGGASGIGASIAIKVAENGGQAIIGDVNKNLAEEFVAYIRQSYKSDDHHFIPLDVTSWDSQTAFFKQAASLSTHGGIDAVVANAGIADPKEHRSFLNPPDYSKLENPKAPPYRTFQVNALGVLYTSDLALSYLSRNPQSDKCSLTPSEGPRDRHLLLVSSIAGVAAVPNIPIYACAKHAVVGLFRSLRISAAKITGVRVNLVCPYFVDTPILGPEGPLFMAGMGMASVSDVTDAAVRLIADKAIVGRSLMIVSRGTKEEVTAAGIEWKEGDKHGNAVRDFAGFDFEQTDVFTRRMIGITNLVSAAKGWVGWLADVVAFFVRAFSRLMGR